MRLIKSREYQPARGVTFVCDDFFCCIGSYERMICHPLQSMNSDSAFADIHTPLHDIE